MSKGTLGELTTLTWTSVRMSKLRDFIGYDGERDVARIYQTPNVPDDWTWSVYTIGPARSGITHGHETDPKEARRKVEAAWHMAKRKRLRDPSGRTIG